MKYDFAIIGSGIGGLTTAALLALKGRSVIVLERNSRPGGALKRFNRKGIPFDIGCHYTGCLGNDGILRVLWEYMGLLPRIEPIPFPEEGCDLIAFRDSHSEVHAYFQEDAFIQELKSIFPAEHQAIYGYLQGIRDIVRDIPFYNLELPVEPFLRSMWQPAFARLDDFIKGLTANQYLQSVFAMPTLLYGAVPSKASLGVHAMVAWSYLQGAWIIKGGGQALADALVALLEKLGVSVICRMDAEKILASGGRVHGVIASGIDIQADNVIYAAHPSYLPSMLPDDIMKPAWRRRVRELENSWSMFVMFGRIPAGTLPKNFLWQNICSLNKGLHFYEQRPDFFHNGPMIMSIPSVRDNENHCSVSDLGVILMKPAWWKENDRFKKDKKGRRSPDYISWKKNVRQDVMELVKKHYSNMVGQVEPLAFSTPFTFRDELKAADGGVYGVLRSFDQINPAARTSLPGLWLTGQNTLMTGIVGTSISALATAGEILGLENMWNEVRQCR